MTRTVEEDLNDPGLARLLSEARSKFEARGRPTGSIFLAALSAGEAAAIDAVWRRSGRRRPRRGLDFPCSLRDLDASLIETFGLTLEEVLRRVGGPLRLRPQERDDRQRRVAAFWDQALAHPLCERAVDVRSWVQRLQRTGALGRTPFATPRGEALTASLRLGATLPREPSIERSTFANEMLGDPHALDDGTAVGSLLIQQLAAREGLQAGRLTAGGRRALLRSYGVLCDPASATVLTLGLAPIGDSPLEQAVRLLAGSHVVLTLGQLAATAPKFPPGLLVRLCENPAVVLRAESQLGARTKPLVCTGGWPGSAVCALLDALKLAGARFEHHGDFDWEGLAIAEWMRDRYDAQPWRFGAADYRAGIDSAAAALPKLRSPRHRQRSDDALAAALGAHGVAVSEEAMLDDLVSDLAELPPPQTQRNLGRFAGPVCARERSWGTNRCPNGNSL